MGSKFQRVVLDKSEKAEETWVNPDHIVAVTPDPRKRFMVLVLDVLDLSGLTWGPKVYKISMESGEELLRA